MDLRETILGASDLATEKVTVPEWGCDVILSELNAEDRLAFDDQAAAIKAKGEKERGVLSVARFLSYAIRAPDGGRLFGDEDVPAIAKKNARVLLRLFHRAAQLSGVSAREAETDSGKSGGPPVAEPSGG